MKESLHCLYCNAILGAHDLRRHKHVELQCRECGEWNHFDYEPDQYVFKETNAGA